jgi:hypothetical protein
MVGAITVAEVIIMDGVEGEATIMVGGIIIIGGDQTKPYVPKRPPSRRPLYLFVSWEPRGIEAICTAKIRQHCQTSPH